MTTTYEGENSYPSNSTMVNILPIYKITNNPTLYTSLNTYLLLFTNTSNSSSLTFNYTITNINFLIIAGGGGGGLQANSNIYPGG